MSFPTGNLCKKFTRSELKRILEPVDCYIEAVLSEENVDVYLLSVSSHFVFDELIIVKTRGRTKIFECIEGILKLADKAVQSLYTRGSFLKPEAQPFPHQFFTDEKEELIRSLMELTGFKKEEILSSVSKNNQRD